MTDHPHFDALETRATEVREEALFAALRDQISHAQKNAPYFADLLSGVDAASIDGRAALAAIPLSRKSDLIERQGASLPFGGLNATAPENLKRIYQSPGPIYDAEGHGADWWRMARAFHAAGFRAGDLIHNAFSYHFTPAGMMVESGAAALNCPVFPAGVGNTELQIKAIADLKPRAYVGTPSFLRVLLEKAADLGLDVSSLGCASVAGEAFLPDQRAVFEDSDIAAFNLYATADVGVIAYETAAREGLVTDEGILVEIVRPGTGDPVPAGEVGEVVVTVFNPDYPLIRFATGDLSAALDGPSPCGRTNMRLKGWMGRADQTTKVKGMFVHPAQIADVVRRHEEISKARLVVAHEKGLDTMVLRCETETHDPGLEAAVCESLQAVSKLKGRVELVTPSSLPNDGKVIDDIRDTPT